MVQAYLSCPDGKLKKPYQDLAAFVKTENIAPGEKEEVLLIFSMADMASYDEEHANFVLVAGDYLLRIGAAGRILQVILQSRI